MFAHVIRSSPSLRSSFFTYSLIFEVDVSTATSSEGGLRSQVLIPSPRAEAKIQMLRLPCFNGGICRANAKPLYQRTNTLVHQIRSADLARMIEVRGTRKGDSRPRVDFIPSGLSLVKLECDRDVCGQTQTGPTASTKGQPRSACQ